MKILVPTTGRFPSPTVFSNEEQIRFVPVQDPDDPYPEILRELLCRHSCAPARGGADLLLLSQGWLRTSLVDRLMRQVPSPILVVPPAGAGLRFRDIALPTTGAEHSRRLIDQLSPFLAPLARITLLHCVGFRASQLASDGPLRSRLVQAHGHLRKLAQQRPGTSLRCLAESAPGPLIEWLARDRCDLVAVSREGRDRFTPLWACSVLSHLASQTQRPILLL